MAKRTTILTTLSFIAGAIFGGWLFSPLGAQTIRTIESKDLMRFDLGSWCEGKEVLIKLQEAGPGTSGKHFHPAHSFAWVVEGSEVQTIQGGPPVTARAGNVIHDGPGEVHETQNTSSSQVPPLSHH